MNLAARPLGGELGRLAAAVEARPSDPQTRLRLASALMKAGEPRAAFTQYRTLLADHPNHPELAAAAGLAAKNAGMEDEGIPLLERAAAAHPRNARLWQVLALLHRAAEQLAPAVVAFDKAARLAPADPKVAQGRAQAALEAGLPAADHFRAALALDPGRQEARSGLIAARFAEEGSAAAIAEAEAWLAQDRASVDAHRQLARLHWASGHKEGFTASFERALEAQPAHFPLWSELIATLMHAELYGDALDAIIRARLAIGAGAFFDANEAVCLAETGRVAEADACFQPLLAGADITVAIRYVRLLLRSGRLDEASRYGLSLLGGTGEHLVWPYLATAWRLLGDPRWQWLEGDPRFVGVYDVGGSLPSLAALAERLRSLHVARSQPLEQSVRGGTQTDGTLFSRVEPEIQALRAAIVEAVRAHVAQLPPHDPSHPLLRHPRDRKLRFSGSWSVRLTGGGHHANHVHPAGWLSSAFYVALPPREERGPPPAGWLTLGELQAEMGLKLEPFRLVEPKPGQLVLFPSTMWHGTRPFAAGERMTVAFDVALPF